MASSSGDWPLTEWEYGMGFTEGLDDEIKGMDELKLSHRLTKTKEEIERYTVDETLDDVQKAIYLLRNGAEVQKQSVLSWLGGARSFDKDQKTKIMNVLLEILPRETRPPFLIMCGRTLKELMAENTFDTKTVNGMLPLIRKMLESRDQETLDVWSETMLTAIQFMSIDVLESEILPEAIVHCGLSQPVPYRIWSCKIFGALAKRMDGKRIESTFYKKAMSLCQDTDYEVRACMAKQLNAIAKGVGPDVTKSSLSNEYMELLNDEELVVKQATLSSLVHLFALPLPDANGTVPAITPVAVPTPVKKLDSLQPSSPSLTTPSKSPIGRRLSISHAATSSLPKQPSTHQSGDRPIIDSDIKLSSIIPTWKKLCADKSGIMLSCIMQDFGLFLWNTRDVMRDDDVEWFINWFHKQAAGKDSSVKELCAFNLPAIAKYLSIITPEPSSSSPSKGKESNATSSLAASSHFQSFHASLDALIADSNAAVRRKVACGLHETAQLLQKDAHRHLKQPWLKLLSDEDTDVFLAVFRTMDVILKCFASDSQWQRSDPECNQILAHILKKHESGISNSKWQWRNSYELLRQFKHFTKFFDPELLVNEVAEVLFNTILDQNAPIATTTVRDICIETLAWFARYVPRLEYRQRIWAMILENLTDVEKTTYKTRICFLEIVKHILELFSSKFFKEQFFFAYLEMGKDPVANVRLKMVELLPAVRKTLKLPSDSQHMQKLNDIVAKLVMEEDDKGVSRLLNQIVENMTNNARDGSSNIAPTAPPLKATPQPSASRVSAPIPAVMQNSSNPTPQQAARIAFEARDKEKEDEESKQLEEEAEFEEQRKRREIEEARLDFTKRLAERTSSGTGTDRSNASIKNIPRTNSKESGLKNQKSTSGTVRKSSKENAAASALLKPLPEPTGRTAANILYNSNGGGGALKSGISKSGTKWGSDQNMSNPSPNKLGPIIVHHQRNSTGNAMAQQHTPPNSDPNSKTSLDKMSPGSSSSLSTPSGVLKTGVKSSLTSPFQTTSHIVNSSTVTGLLPSSLKAPTSGTLSWTAASSAANNSGRTLPAVSNVLNISGTAGYGPSNLSKEMGTHSPGHGQSRK